MAAGPDTPKALSVTDAYRSALEEHSQETVEASVTNDGQAIELLVRRHSSVLIRFFQKRGLSREESEDAVQEVWARLAHRQGLAGLQSLDGYVFQTAANIAVDLHRRGRAHRRDRHDSYAEESHAQPDLSPVEVIEGEETLAQVIAALSELPERARNIFVLARIERVRQAEIARQFGISLSAVEKHIQRAMVHLMTRVGRDG
jgi:RNA polymerase sigma factor (sigma-70 family)